MLSDVALTVLYECGEVNLSKIKMGRWIRMDQFIKDEEIVLKDVFMC